VSEELLDDGQGSPALDLSQGPPVPEAMRVDALLDPGLRRERSGAASRIVRKVEGAGEHVTRKPGAEWPEMHEI
jgi:hypothetical protein